MLFFFITGYYNSIFISNTSNTKHLNINEKCLLLYEKKLTEMEKEKADALEVAAQENEEGKEEKG